MFKPRDVKTVGEARRIVEEALAAGYATLVAGGGDGILAIAAATRRPGHP